MNVLLISYLLVAASLSDAATVGRQSTHIGNQGEKATKDRRPAVTHSAFANAGKKPGTEIWRIENFEPVPVVENDFGKFHTGDSYIVLFTKKTGNTLTWDIHFWLGSETSQDESSAAAILTVQLDDQLGGHPVQHREVQGQESQAFLSQFKNGVRYVPGGVASGLRHVDTTVEKKLYQVKGKKNVRVKRVELSAASLNRGDCFILDAGNDIYVYVGPKAKRVERLKASSAANLIRDQDHSGRGKVTIIDEAGTEDELVKFFEVLGSGTQAKVPEESVGGDDEQFERNEENTVALHKVSDATGKMDVQKINQKPLKQEMLDTNDCFILNTAKSDVFVWIGKKCNNKERTEAMAKGQTFKTSNPSWTKVEKVIEGAEPSGFTQYFSTWRGGSELHTRLIR